MGALPVFVWGSENRTGSGCAAEDRVIVAGMAEFIELNSGLLSPLLVETRPAEELGIDLDSLSRFVDATGPLAVVDLETTGLSEDPEAEILEFGAVLVEPGARSITTVESLLRPRLPLPLTISHLTGLIDADVIAAPTIGEVSKQIQLALDGRTLIAHNADFERSFLTRFVSIGLGEYRYLDTQDFLAISHPDSADLRLETFTRAMLQHEERHRALSDALDTLRVMSAAAVGVAAGERRYSVARSALESYAPESPWLPLFCGDAQLAAEDPNSQFAKALPTSEKPVPFDENAIVAALSDVDRGRRYFPNYRVREQQLDLARHFVRNLDTGGRLLLEGGTGVGKSLAYLAAAIPFVMERVAGGVRDPVVISTRTKLLQDQLLTKDIPAAAAMFGYPDLKAMSIKGRANYICARRAAVVLAEGSEPQMFAADRLAYAALAACAGIRRHGEVGALPAGLHHRFRPLRDLARRSVAARAEQCSREQCATERDCPFGRRRAALAELSGVVDEVYALEVKPLEVLEEIDDLFGRPSEGRRGAGLLGRSSVRAMEGDVRAWRRGIQQDFVALGRCLADRASEFGEVQLPAYPDRVFPQAAELAQMAAERLAAAADAADRMAQSRGIEEDDLLAIGRITAELRTAADALRGAFSGGDGDAVAAFERLEPPFERWRLVVRAVSPADAFHQRFAERLETLACVSASLFVAGDPFAALGELELERHGEPPVTRISVESPFPYEKHMRVVALQSEGNLVEETTEVLADLTRLLGGRTLGLFTSLRRMRDVSDLLSERLRGEGYEILMPRRALDDPAALVERFTRAGGGMILLGARSFWQGLDIPGPALQAVVIEKLPFEVPTELRKRREARLRTAGDDAFGRFTMGKMLLNLKQMSGRLIRSEEDRGLITIVEGRTDKGYFRRLQEAFPPDIPVKVGRREDLPDLIAEVGIETKQRATLRSRDLEGA